MTGQTIRQTCKCPQSQHQGQGLPRINQRQAGCSGPPRRLDITVPQQAEQPLPEVQCGSGRGWQVEARHQHIGQTSTPGIPCVEPSSAAKRGIDRSDAYRRARLQVARQTGLLINECPFVRRASPVSHQGEQRPPVTRC